MSRNCVAAKDVAVKVGSAIVRQIYGWMGEFLWGREGCEFSIREAVGVEGICTDMGFK